MFSNTDVCVTGNFQQAYCMEKYAVKYSAVPWFMSFIKSLITAHKAELLKLKLVSHYFPCYKFQFVLEVPNISPSAYKVQLNTKENSTPVCSNCIVMALLHMSQCMNDSLSYCDVLHI
jgi:hypothetical protein